MQEIKYRAWDNTLNKMHCLAGLVKYGDGWHNGDPDLCFYELYFCMGGFRKAVKKEIDLMQFIGQEDKNGREIYEGDIMKDGGTLGFVFYDETAAQFMLIENNEGYAITFEHEREREVIGNIYETPKLLR